jgi:tetraacyldisaccharide 4'-kinase
MNPLSGIFGGAVALRNSLYDRRWLKIHKLAKPVVSVGNISVGGSGKTPFVIALGELLKERGITFDILSRGYGRGSKAVLVVDPEGTALDFGDEPLLMARKLHVPVVIGADRYQAGLLAEKKFSSQLHLLDDGFQHRRLHRDFDIVMLPQADLQDTLLPLGRLREPQASLDRADVLVVDHGGNIPERFAEKQIWNVSRRLDLPATSGRALAFCGIARSGQFFAQLRSLPVELVETHAFADHHRYSSSDIQLLFGEKKQSQAEYFITTEKDEVNLRACALAEQLGSVRIARLKTTLENPDKAMLWLISTLERRCGCRF